MRDLVSVIIPVYNVEPYLKECINSAVNQTYRELEIIVVDDGSTDNSGEICDEYARKDERIRVVHKKNGGLSDARNIGIKNAKGEYIFFLDGDDLIPSYAIEKFLIACLEYDAAISVAGEKRFVDKIPAEESNEEGMTYVENKSESIRKMLLQNGFGHEATGKLYRRDLWLNDAFPEGKLYEDYATTYRIVSKCEKVAIRTDCLYWYRVRNGSIMKSRLTKKNMQLLDISAEVTNYLEKEVPEVKKEAQYLQMVTYLKLMKGILDGGFSTFPEEQIKIYEFVESCKPLFKINFVKRKDIIKAKSLFISKRLFYIIYSVGERMHL